MPVNQGRLGERVLEADRKAVSQSGGQPLPPIRLSNPEYRRRAAPDIKLARFDPQGDEIAGRGAMELRRQNRPQRHGASAQKKMPP
jgi:hypothetical protein